VVEPQPSRNDWLEVTAQKREDYYHKSKNLLDQLQVPTAVRHCQNFNCTEEKHLEEIENFYAELSSALVGAASSAIKPTGKKNEGKFNIPAWNSVVKSKHQIAKAAFRLRVNCNRPKTGDIYRNMTERKKDFKYSLRQCRKNAEMHKANGLAAALQADKTKKSFWKKVNNKNRSSSLPTLVGGANGGSEIIKMWKDYFKGILNSGNSANRSAESVEHSIDCKEVYLGLEMPMCSFVSLAALLQKLPLNKSPGPDCISAEHLLYADESQRFFLSELFKCVLFTGIYPIPV